MKRKKKENRKIYMLTSYQVPLLDAKATCKWNEQKQQAPERKRMKETHVQTHVGSNRRRTVLYSRKQGR